MDYIEQAHKSIKQAAQSTVYPVDLQWNSQASPSEQPQDRPSSDKVRKAVDRVRQMLGGKSLTITRMYETSHDRPEDRIRDSWGGRRPI